MHLIFILSTGLYGQVTFQKDFRTSMYIEGYSLIETDDSCFIAAGAAKGMFLLKVNRFGDTLWSRDIGTGGLATSINKTGDGNFIVCGSIGCCGSQDVLMLKINGNGDTIWTKQYGSPKDEMAMCVIPTTDGGYALSGWGYNMNSRMSCFIIKTDPLGAIQWSKTYGHSTGTTWGYSISQTSDSGFVLCGQSDETCYAIRVDANGDPVWDKTYHAYAYGTARCIKETYDGGFIMCGETYDPRDDEKGILIETDSLGDVLWTRIYAYGPTPFSSVAELPAGYLIGGPYAIKTDLHGDIIWARSLSTRFNSGFPTSDGGLAFVTGQMRIVKTDSNGLAACNEDNLAIKKVASSLHEINNHSTVVNVMPYATKPYKNAVIRSGVNVYPVCSGAMGVDGDHALYNISVYPNPNSGDFTLAFQGSHADTRTVSITVRNTFGQSVFHREVTMYQPHSERLVLQYLPAGIYFIGINAEQFNESRKIIIE